MTRSARGYDRPAVGQFTVEQSSTGQAMDEQHAAGWPGFARALRAEVLKGAHAAPRKVTLIAPLPFCALGMMASGALGGEGAGGTGFATYGRNYWYVLMLPVSVVLMSSSVANLDARQGLRPVLGLPMPPARTWWAYVLELVLVANLVVCAASVVTSNVAQVDDVLAAMERMRVSLRDSLEARWAAEEDRAGTWSRSCTSSRCRSPSSSATPSSSRVTSRRAASPGMRRRTRGRSSTPRTTWTRASSASSGPDASLTASESLGVAFVLLARRGGRPTRERRARSRFLAPGLSAAARTSPIEYHYYL